MEEAHTGPVWQRRIWWGEKGAGGEVDETLEGEVRAANKAEDNATVLPAKGRTLIFFGVAVIASPWRPRRQLACDRRFYYIVPYITTGKKGMNTAEAVVLTHIDASAFCMVGSVCVRRSTDQGACHRGCEPRWASGRVAPAPGEPI